MVKRKELVTALEHANIDATVLGGSGGFCLLFDDSAASRTKVEQVLRELGAHFSPPQHEVCCGATAEYEVHRLKRGRLNPPCVHGDLASLMQFGSRTICTRCATPQKINDPELEAELGVESEGGWKNKSTKRTTQHQFMQDLRQVAAELTSGRDLGRKCWPDRARPLLFYLHGIQVTIWPDWSIEHYYGMSFVHYTIGGKCQLRKEL